MRIPAAMFIANEPVRLAETITVEDPGTGEQVGAIPRGRAKEVNQAVRAAAEAFPAWSARSSYERGQALRRIARALAAARDELARLESLDTGKPLSQARGDVDVAARYFDFYAGLADKFGGYEIPISPEYLALAQRVPYGVIGMIVPWNYPLQIASRGIAPALAAGNTAVVKPAEEASLTALRLAELAADAGLPPGVLNVVTGYGPEAGAALVAHPGVRHVSFTGSREVGEIVMAAAARQVKPVTLELGGKSPQIVFADADLDEVEPVLLRAILQNAGQTCSAGSRLLVEAAIADELVERLRSRFESVRIGRGEDDPDLGPLVSRAQLERVERHVAAARQAGLRLVTGGRRAAFGPLGRGYFFEPTIFTEVTADAPLFQEEVFGPVLAVTPFATAAEAVQLANATDFGLVAAIWTRDVSRAVAVANRLEAGQVFVNTYSAGGGVELPFGGFKESGIGREKGIEAMYTYTQTRTVVIRTSGLA